MIRGKNTMASLDSYNNPCLVRKVLVLVERRVRVLTIDKQNLFIANQTFRINKSLKENHCKQHHVI